MTSWNTISNRAGFMLRQHTRKLAELQEQAASGARVRRPSDAPDDAYRIMNLRAQVQSLTTYSRNLQDVARTLDTSHDLLGEISSSLTQVKQAVAQVLSGTYGPDAHTAAAEKIDSILEQVLSLANTRSLGSYLLGGANTSDPPFLVTRTDGKITAVRYQGSLDHLDVPVAPGVEYPGRLIGERLFRSDRREAPQFLGNTGAAPAAATSSVRGDVYLSVRHALTTFPAPPGITAGDSSAAGDTILGDHVLTVAVNGPTRTLSLDGGAAVEFQGTESDLAVTGPAGDVVHVNVRNWVDYEGEIAISATGRLSIDDGASFTDLASFTNNVAVVDSRTARVLYLDATGISRTGVEPIRVPGTCDLFDTLMNTRDVLLNTRGLTSARQHELMSRAMDSLDEIARTITRNMTSLGTRQQSLDVLKGSLESIQARAGDQADLLENADLVQVATDLARVQTLYEMTLAVASRLLTTSLLDYL